MSEFGNLADNIEYWRREILKYDQWVHQIMNRELTKTQFKIRPFDTLSPEQQKYLLDQYGTGWFPEPVETVLGLRWCRGGTCGCQGYATNPPYAPSGPPCPQELRRNLITGDFKPLPGTNNWSPLFMYSKDGQICRQICWDLVT